MVSWGQLMISRPIVAASLAGLVLGDPVGGMWAGVLLEILSLHQLPVGASRQWDMGPGSVAAAVVATRLPDGEASALLLAAGVGVLVAWLGSWSVHAMRHFNARLVVAGSETRLTPAWLSARHLAAMAVDFLRAGLLTLAAVALVAGLLGRTSPAPFTGPWLPLALVALAGLAVGGDLAMVARGRAMWVAFLSGIVLTSAIWIWLR